MARRSGSALGRRPRRAVLNLRRRQVRIRPSPYRIAIEILPACSGVVVRQVCAPVCLHSLSLGLVLRYFRQRRLSPDRTKRDLFLQPLRLLLPVPFGLKMQRLHCSLALLFVLLAVEADASFYALPGSAHWVEREAPAVPFVAHHSGACRRNRQQSVSPGRLLVHVSRYVKARIGLGRSGGARHGWAGRHV